MARGRKVTFIYSISGVGVNANAQSFLLEKEKEREKKKATAKRMKNSESVNYFVRKLDEKGRE